MGAKKMSEILEKIDTERLVSDAHYLEEYIRFLLTDKENWATDFTISQQYKAVWFLDWNFHNIHRRVGILVFFEGHAKVLWTERTIWGFKECLGIFEAFVKPMYNTFLDIADLVKEERRRQDVVMGCQECQYYEYGSVFWKCDTCTHGKDGFCDVLKEKSGFCGVFKEDNIICPHYSPSKKDNQDLWKSFDYYKKYLLDCEFACDKYHEGCKLYSDLNKEMLCCSKRPYSNWESGYCRMYPEPVTKDGDIVYVVWKKKDILSGDFSKMYTGRIDFYEKTMKNGDYKYREFDLQDPELVTADMLEKRVEEYKKYLKIDDLYPIVRRPKKG